jgi:hypothetical protein
METLRRHTQTGRPLAGTALLERWEADLGRPLQARSVGRPRKHEGEEEKIGDCP